MLLDFEAQVSAIEQRIKELKQKSGSDRGIEAEIAKLQQRVNRLLIGIYSKLTPWQRVAVARHPCRPKFTDYLNGLFADFIELSGDRLFGDDRAIVGGLAKYNGIPCLVVGQEKGSDTESRLRHNFGMAKPEGYRKVYRLFDLADRFGLSIISFVDTSGAYPGIESEERGQAESIAKCIEKSFQISSPFVSVVIGEGGSGGAISLATSDFVLMLEHSIYSVISPEGCASILWKDDSKAEIAAASQKMTSDVLKSLQIIDYIIKEPTGGAHRNKEETVRNVGKAVTEFLEKSLAMSVEERKNHKRSRFLSVGEEFVRKDS
jgi:acetyl-CoA carboxylase carboxyl transferase subunit alpha